MNMQQQITDAIGSAIQPALTESIGADMAMNVVSTFGTFAFLAGELTILFLIVSFIIGVILEYMPAEKIQKNLRRWPWQRSPPGRQQSSGYGTGFSAESPQLDSHQHFR